MSALDHVWGVAIKSLTRHIQVFLHASKTGIADVSSVEERQ
jgi:hypothetical protein